MVLQVWPYYFIYDPFGSALSFNTAAVSISTTTFQVTLSVDSNCSMQEVGISVLYINTTKIFQNTYSQFIDVTTYVITGSNAA
jgi:hypothetical protein